MYVYTRYVLSELYTVLIIPSDLHGLVLNGGMSEQAADSSENNDEHQNEALEAQIAQRQRQLNNQQ